MSKVPPHFLVVEDNRQTCYQLQGFFDGENWRTTFAYEGNNARTLLSKQPYTAMLLDYSLPDMLGTELIAFSKQLHPGMPILMFSGYDQATIGFEAHKAGADDYIVKGTDWKTIYAKLEQHVASPNQKAKTKTKSSGAPEIIGKSAVMVALREKIEKFAKSRCNVLILGPNGSGKELVAANLHYKSKRKDEAFIVDNTAGGSEGLVDAKYFGYKKGAFTGADKDQLGLFSLADKGILFLDEIGDMPLESQAKMLRAIQYQIIFPAGATKEIPVNIRFITATNKDLEREIEKGCFREDLYHRISTGIITVPSLNDRIEDIEELTSYFLAQACEEEEFAPKTINPQAISFLKDIDWTGNVRQLSNAIRTAVINAGEMTTVIEATHFDGLKKRK